MVCHGKGIDFDPEKDIPDLSGKVITLLGNAGLGKASILALVKKNPTKVYLTARDAKKCVDAMEEIQRQVPNAAVTFLECDLASLASVQNAARRFVSESSRLDVLICNAGIMATPPGLTKDGYEIQFGTNHLGHALLINLLLPTMLRTAEEPGSDVRIVSLTSTGMGLHPPGGIVFNDLRTTQDQDTGAAWRRYGQSKLANILYAAELARRYPSITSLSIHPGTVNTGLVDNLGFWNEMLVRATNLNGLKTPEEGARNQLWAATGNKENIVNGEYYRPIGVPGRHVRLSKDENLAKRLWEWTAKEYGSLSLNSTRTVNARIVIR